MWVQNHFSIAAVLTQSQIQLAVNREPPPTPLLTVHVYEPFLHVITQQSDESTVKTLPQY